MAVSAVAKLPTFFDISLEPNLHDLDMFVIGNNARVGILLPNSIPRLPGSPGQFTQHQQTTSF
jgi:hypothetical protein